MNRTSRRSVAAATLLLAFTVAGCSRPAAQTAGSSGTTTVTVSPTETVPTGSVTPTATPGSGTSEASGTTKGSPIAPTRPAAGENGKQFGYLKGARKRHGTGAVLGTFVEVDYARFLTGKEAADAAKAAGEESPPPNDYFIENTNPALRAFAFEKGAKVGYLESIGGTKIRWMPAEQFAARLVSAPDDDPLKVNPYWIWLKNGRIVKMEQQYLP